MRDLVLIGAGHTHVQVLKMAAMQPLPAQITLVVDDPVAVYSGMVPGLVAGRYAAHEVEIDAHPLARRAGIRVLHAAATRIDSVAKQVHLKGRPPIRYDLASVNIGSTVAGLTLPGVVEHTVPTRPIRGLVDQLNQRLEHLGPEPKVVIVGAGAGGVELAFCLDHRLRAQGLTPHITLAYRSSKPLPGQPPRVADRVIEAAERRGITLRPNTSIDAVTATSLSTPDGPLPTDLTVWVTGAAGLRFGRDSELPCDPRGFIWVDDTLRVEGCDSLFAAGDCAVLRSWPEVPKAGVYAVRQGPVLLANLRAALVEEPLIRYRAQRDFLSLLNLGDGTAIGTKWGVVTEGHWMMEYKDRIDRAFMEKFQVLDSAGRQTPDFSGPMSAMDGEMVCGGCAAKVAQQPLAAALGRLQPVANPNIVIGPAEADDVVVWQDGDRLTVQNIDAFSAFTDDPFVVGRVAAHNATSDVWAKGVRPRFAMATVQIPTDSNQEETLFQVMAGLRASLDPDDIALLGGHTTLGEKLVVGLVVTGFADTIPWRNSGAQPGDGLVLTRPLGTGALFHADMAGKAPGTAVREALRIMQVGNRAASELAMGHLIHAATDVTGFGLAGHLAEMVRASQCGASLTLSQLPLYDGVRTLLRDGERSTFHDQNRTLVRSIAALHQVAEDPVFEVLFDPQTAGGLLFSTPDPVALVEHLRANGETAWPIGSVTPAHSSGALFEVRP